MHDMNEFEQKKWAWDIDSYVRGLKLLKLAQNQSSIDWLEKHLKTIRERWSNIKNWPE